ncbi:hypothetical protein T484DRAFT_1841582, partial [Baffinella frigidus]
MTVKFFPLFFADEIGMSPFKVNLIYVVNPFLLCACSFLAQKLSRWIGRMEVGVSWEAVGVSLLFLMASQHAWWSRPEIIVPVFIVRT